MDLNALTAIVDYAAAYSLTNGTFQIECRGGPIRASWMIRHVPYALDAPRRRYNARTNSYVDVDPTIALFHLIDDAAHAIVTNLFGPAEDA